MATTNNFMNSDKISDQVRNSVQVFCRLRPLKSSTDISSAQIRSLNTVLFPSRNGLQLKLNADHETHYVFKQVFDEAATQADIFNVVARPLVERLIRGCNSLFFTYGVTGSGKTYTMTGVENQCGVLPRCLRTLFQTIAGYNAPRGTFQPDHLNSFEIATEPIKSTRNITLRRKNSEPDFNLESMGTILPVSGINEHHTYAVFVSYVEIYNNSVYDLLEDGAAQKVHQSHIVREDGQHNMYIHGAIEIEVISIQDAIEVFQIGQKRKRMGETALNAESSRSHAVFNIRLVQAPLKEFSSVDENWITISQLSLVDLAGSERSSRTKNTGARLRETGSINNSLMKLRECLENLRENQQATAGYMIKKIPYRDSKLTYLFKNFFEGEGQVSMIVCINPDIKDNVENAQVLKFAEMTQEVQILNTKPIALSTPLKRQAWNTDQTSELERPIENLRNCNERFESKNRPISSIKKPIRFIERMETLKSAPCRVSRELDFTDKKIMFLEKQNLELRLELTRIRAAYEQISGHSWTDDIAQRKSASILSDMSKPLLTSQKSNICINKKKTESSLRKHVTNLEDSVLSNKSFQDAFQTELKLKLQKQREKLEDDLVKNSNESEKAWHSLSFDTNKNNVIENAKYYENIQNKMIERHTKIDPHKENLPVNVEDSPNLNFVFGEDNPKGMEIESRLSKAAIVKNPLLFEEEASYSTPKPQKYKFEQCLQMDVFASFQLMTPKMKSKEHERSTTNGYTLSNAKRKLDFFNENITPQSCKSFLKNCSFQKDPDFDKRERELSLRMENHRKNQKGNRCLMDILCSTRRSKSSTNLFHKSFNKKNLFPEERKKKFNAEL